MREGASRSLGKKITWDEKPFHWVYGKEFSVLRIFHNGPLLSVLSHLELEPSEIGSRLTYSIEAVARSFVWSIVARYYLGVQTRRHFHKVFSRMATSLAGEVELTYTQPVLRLSRGALARLRNAESSLVQAGFTPDLAGRLTSQIEGAPDDASHRIKPYSLGDAWGADRETVLRLCLHTTRLGLLELTWDLMCPLCRGAKERLESLSALRAQAHCPSCNIEFDANFDRSVEVTFRPSQQIRQLEAADYCVGGPGNTPHIMAQQSVSPEESVTLSINLVEGVYRLRGPQLAGSALLEVSATHAKSGMLTVSCSRRELAPQRMEVPPGGTRLCLQNLEDEELLIILERMEWPDDAVTAAQVTALQDFRDLFSSEVLAPDEQFEVRYLSFMFTDLRSSTALYRGRGDAPAFAMVRDHFQVLSECVAKHHGAVVKTMGDSIMAVFREPGDAVAAGFDIHRAFNSEGSGDLGLVLKIAVHSGPCIAVNLNGCMDYFGTTVNTAVRLESHSLGGDVVAHADLLEDPVA